MMSVTPLRSSADTASEAFKRNHAANTALAAELRDKLEVAARGGSDRARDRPVSRGKLLPRDRVEVLTDPGSPFLELSPLAAGGMYDGDSPGAGIITGSAASKAASASSSPTTRPSRAAPTTR